MPLMQNRRRFLASLSSAAAAGLFDTPKVRGEEAPLETTRIRLYDWTGLCIAPQFVAESLFVNENDGMATITLRRSGDLRQAVTLDYSTSDGTAAAGKDYSPQNGTITFAPGAATQTIKIPILDNPSVDGPRTVNVTVSNSAVFPKPSTATLTIGENEQQVLFDPSFASDQAAFRPGGNYRLTADPPATISLPGTRYVAIRLRAEAPRK